MSKKEGSRWKGRPQTASTFQGCYWVLDGSEGECSDEQELEMLHRSTKNVYLKGSGMVECIW